ncbi:MAG: ATP-binding cassette domain-containing protein [Deltaproteobacteria bacterium]|nr:ATP-binding cassette domain-containing protein [Deltaproteobacteria bacterium]
MTDIAIKVENISKCYRIGLKEHMHETFGGALGAWFKSPFANLKRLKNLTNIKPGEPESDDLVWALKDVSFEVKQGEVIGIIGRNGAGKSTLLKILSRIVEPTSGRALINGRVASLLEVGTGFHPELTGRENIYLNGAVLGMTKREINSKFDDIVSFAEIGKFLDTPVKRYSSGMAVRLAFAVAAHLDPEILLIDEVLAVGDVVFQKKCLGKMGEVAKSGRTVLFVSHNMGAVAALCGNLILIEKGKIKKTGEPDNVISQYLNNGMGLSGSVVVAPEEIDSKTAFSFLSARLSTPGHGEISDVKLAGGVDVRVEYILREPMRRLIIAVELWDGNGICVLMTTDMDQKENPYADERLPGTYCATCHIPGDYLRPGRYFITIGAAVPAVKLLGKLPGQLSFDVMEVEPAGVRIGQGRRGVIAPQLAWETVRIPGKKLKVP